MPKQQRHQWTREETVRVLVFGSCGFSPSTIKAHFDTFTNLSRQAISHKALDINNNAGNLAFLQGQLPNGQRIWNDNKLNLWLLQYIDRRNKHGPPGDPTVLKGKINDSLKIQSSELEKLKKAEIGPFEELKRKRPEIFKGTEWEMPDALSTMSQMTRTLPPLSGPTPAYAPPPAQPDDPDIGSSNTRRRAAPDYSQFSLADYPDDDIDPPGLDPADDHEVYTQPQVLPRGPPPASSQQPASLSRANTDRPPSTQQSYSVSGASGTRFVPGLDPVFSLDVYSGGKEPAPKEPAPKEPAPKEPAKSARDDEEELCVSWKPSGWLVPDVNTFVALYEGGAHFSKEIAPQFEHNYGKNGATNLLVAFKKHLPKAEFNSMQERRKQAKDAERDETMTKMDEAKKEEKRKAKEEKNEAKAKKARLESLRAQR